LGPELARASRSQVLLQIPKAYPLAQVSQNIELCLQELQLANLQGSASTLFYAANVKFDFARRHTPFSSQ
jgi:hypothetical protein